MYVPESEYKDRRSAIRKQMADRQLKALLVWGQPRGSFGLLSATNDIGYVTDWPIRQPGFGSALLVLPLEGKPAILVSGPLYSLDHARNISNLSDIRQVETELFADEARDVLTDRGVDGGRIGVVRLNHLPLWFYEDLIATFSEDQFRNATDLFAELRTTKSANEIERLEESALLSDLMFETLIDVIEPGVQRTTVTEAMEHAARAEGAEFATTWISSGPLGGKRPSFEPRGISGAFEPNDLVVVGLQVVYNNYWGHAIRAGTVGEPSDEQEKLFDVVLEAQDAILDRARPGTELADLYSAVQSVYDESGYENSFRSLHGLGLRYGGRPKFPQPGRIHKPSVSSLELEPGMVFEAHPNVWDGPDGNAIVALGDMLVITENGAECLTKFPRELFVC